ncbi:single-stranded-DNA-specific exonuclease RecJ [Staphylospora marina]|uniref:single-stranded-DNA-specific exonuclease RecJ n=1 Tax=Staphylospora marina TaxID=2490858 RepID=UPI0013DDE8E1|nr:single-stranded-DNA-specific exonuclease RecJ [Staphylospora marina]
MLRARTRWQLQDADQAMTDRLVQTLGIHPLVAAMLVSRGITTADEAKGFLNPRLEDLPDPFLLDGMDKAVQRIRKAIASGEQILVYGDYDADGVCSTALLLLVLKRLGAVVDHYIPNRFREGYGIHGEALKTAKVRGISVVVSVDTGISAAMEAELAKELGLDLIITDHHEPPDVLPDAYAVINPKKPGCPYPNKALAGVGVAFKLASALLGHPPEEEMDILALGTIADLVPLTGENRVFAAHGLKRMNLRRRTGIRALLDVAGIDGEVTSGHVAFGLGPRINASGRLDSAELAVRLLLSEDPGEAELLARKLDEMNRKRQELVEEMAAEAAAVVESDPETYRHAIVVAKEGWNVGVVGIVASRLVERFYRPSVVLGIDAETGKAKGSARSIAGFDMYGALTACKELLPHFGGHAMAAGMTLRSEDIGKLQAKLSEQVRLTMKPEDMIPMSRVEAVLSVDEVEHRLIEQIEALAPFGMGNPTPLFVLRDLRLAKMKVVGAQGNHLKLTVEAGGKWLDAVAFRMGELADDLSHGSRVELLGELSINEWNGNRKPQLLVRDLAVPHLQLFDWRSNRFSLDRLSDRDDPGTLYVCMRTDDPVKNRHLAGKAVAYWPEAVDCPDSVEGVRRLVLVDPPPDLETFSRVIRRFVNVERIYFLFGDASFDDVLAKTPDREHFKKLYACLHARGKLRFPADLPALVRATGLQKRTLSFMIQVFEELGFLKRSHGLIELVPSPVKKALTESELYRSQIRRSEVMEKLILSGHEELCRLTLSISAFRNTGGLADGLQGKDSRHPGLSAAGDSV